MKGLRVCAAVALAVVPATAGVAGPPYLTDDPAPTGLGEWEIYAFATGEGRRSELDADAGVDLNYGPVKDVQLTATLPLSFSHDPADSWGGGAGDVELGVKYRFLNRAGSGVSAAIFPRVILPTSNVAGGSARLLLPLWVQKDAGPFSLFGGGGYEINPGPANRDFWQGAAAVTWQFSERLSAGIELTRQGPDTDGGTPQTRGGLGAVVKLGEHNALLVSGGPTWTDHQTSYRFYTALGIYF